jgi:hypothetical protein
MAITAVQNLLGLRKSKVGYQTIEAIAGTLMKLPNVSFEELFNLTTPLAETEPPDVAEDDLHAAANRVLTLLSRRPNLLNNVILAALEQGIVAHNIDYLVNELKVSIAGPWVVIPTYVHSNWARINLAFATSTHIPVVAAQIIDAPDGITWAAYPTESTRSVPGSAEDPQVARDQADKALRAAGWLLL